MKERQSNFELLRIIATLFIITVHCNGWFINGLEWRGVNGWYYGGCAKTLWRIVVQSITCIGVDLFVLISGYFAIKPKLHSVVNLFTCLCFFYVGCYLMNCIINHQPFSLHWFLYNAAAFSRENWFIQCYLFLMLLAPVANVFMDSLSEKKSTLYLLLFIAVAFYFGCVRDSKYFYFNQGYSVTTLLLIYLIGRYIRLFLNKRVADVKSSTIFLLYLLSVILIGVIIATLNYGTQGRWISYCSPLLISSSVLLFLLFCRLNYQSRLINWIGSSCLAVYILHTSSPVIQWLSKLDATYFMEESLFKWVGMMSIVIFGIFVSAILLDKLRILLCSPLLNIVGKLENKLAYARE